MKRHTTSIAALVVTVVALVVILGTVRVNAQDVLLDENFDSYSPGGFPVGWDSVYGGAGWQYQVVANDQSVSSPNSFTMKGSPSNSAVVDYDFASPPPDITYSGRVRVAAGAATANIAAMSLWNKDEATWGTYYCQLRFGDTAIWLAASGVSPVHMQSYNREQWYHWKVEYDAVAKTASVWIDDVQVGADEALTTGSLGYNALALASEHGAKQCWYDDIYVTKPSAAPPNLTLDDVEGLDAGGHIPAGSQVKFIMRLSNTTGESILGFTLGFRIYSPDGALYDPIVLDTMSHGWPDMFDLTPFDITYHSADGYDADTVGTMAVVVASSGIPAGFDEQVWWIETAADPSSVGKHLCLDSSYYPPSGAWLWVTSSGGSIPAWDGPHCFEVVDNQSPVITNNPYSLVFDHCDMALYDFDADDPEGDPYWFEILAGPGTIITETGEWSYMPCLPDVDYAHELVVRACDEYGCGPEEICYLTFTNMAPVFTSGCPDTVSVTAGDDLIYQFQVDDVDCDPSTLTVVDVSPPPVGVYYMTYNELTFETDALDEGIDYIFTVEVTDGLDGSDCILVVRVSPAYDFYTIPELYDSIAVLEGQRISVLGEYTNPEDRKLLCFYPYHLQNHPKPPKSTIFVDGIEPDSGYWNGGLVIVSGIVSSVADPYPDYLDDTLLITVAADHYYYLDSGFVVPDTVYPPKVLLPLLGRAQEPTDSPGTRDDYIGCQFAIIVSGGINAKENKAQYWKNIETYYNYLVNGLSYDPANIEIVYFNGTSGNEALIPSANVKECTEAKIQEAHTNIVQKITACKALGQSSAVRKLFTNHGVRADSVPGWDTDGICLLGKNVLTPASLKAMQQPLITACCSLLIDELLTCYGGLVANALQQLDAKGKAQIHVNSAAGSHTSACEEHVYLQTKLSRLQDGWDYETSVNNARVWMRHIISWWINTGFDREITNLEELGNIPGGFLLQPFIDSLKVKYIKWRDEVYPAALAEGGSGWVRFQCKKFCQQYWFAAPPGGQVKLTFRGTGCANVTVYESSGTEWTRRVIWNWNVPGGFVFSTGNDERIINVGTTSTGRFYFHNDARTGQFEVTVESFQNRPGKGESPSNPEQFAGFTVGGAGEYPLEFGDIVADYYTTPGTDEIGFDLIDVPIIIGPGSGVEHYTAQFTALADNQWWDTMDVYINVSAVFQPGMLSIHCPTASSPTVSVYIDTTGEYTVPLGAVTAPGAGELTFDASSGVIFAWDSWALRTLVPTWTPPDCDIRGDINHDGAGPDISDLVYFVDYMFNGGPEPPCLEEADVDGSGGIDISDLVYLVDYMFTGGPPPVPCP